MQRSTAGSTFYNCMMLSKYKKVESVRCKNFIRSINKLNLEYIFETKLISFSLLLIQGDAINLTCVSHLFWDGNKCCFVNKIMLILIVHILVEF